MPTRTTCSPDAGLLLAEAQPPVRHSAAADTLALTEIQLGAEEGP